MTSKDAFDIAASIGTINLRVLQFFVAVCTLFGGWVLVGDTVRALPLYGWERMVMITIFAASTGPMAVSMETLSRRSNAAMTLAHELAKAEGLGPKEAVQTLFEPSNPRVAALGSWAVIICVCAMVFFVGPSDPVTPQ